MLFNNHRAVKHGDKKDVQGGSLAWIIWSVAALFYLYEFFVRVAPAVMEDELQQAMGLSATRISFAVAMYYFIYAPLQIMIGMLLDRMGARRLLVVSTALVAIGCFACMWKVSFLAFTVGRFLQGFGSAFAFLGTMYLTTVWFPKSQVALVAGLTTTLGMLGAIAGEAPMAALVENAGWQYALGASGIAGLIIALMILIVVPRAPKWERKRREKHYGKETTSLWPIGLKEVLVNKQTWILGIIAAALYMPLPVFGELWGVEYLKRYSGVSAKAASGAVSMLYFGWLVGAPLAGWYSDYIGGRRKILRFGLIFSGLALLPVIFMPQMPMGLIYLCLFLNGFFASGEIIAFVSSMEVNPSYSRGTAMATINMIVMFIGGIFQPVVGKILDIMGKAEMERIGGSAFVYTVDHFRVALASLPIMICLGLIVSAFLKETYRKDPVGEAEDLSSEEALEEAAAAAAQKLS